MPAFKYPLLVLNCKTYDKGSGKRAVELAKALQKAAKKHSIGGAIAVQAIDLVAVANAVKIPVLAQHCDPLEPGSHTGAIAAEEIKRAGAAGALLNHSEKRLDLQTLKAALDRLHKNRLLALVCAPHVRLAMLIEGLKPDCIAVEPPELIGSGIAVSRARPEVITETTAHVKKPVLCGAGITDGDDAERAVELGAQGVLVASAVVLAKQPAKVIDELAKGLRTGWAERKKKKRRR